MERSPVVLSATLPPPDDPAIRAILAGLCRATGARGVLLTLKLLPDGPRASYEAGATSGKQVVTLVIGLPDAFEATFDLSESEAAFRSGAGAVEALAPLLEGALQAAIQKCASRREVDLLAEVVGAASEATLVIGPDGDLLYANPRGEQLLALHTRRPLARRATRDEAVPLLHLVSQEIDETRRRGERRSVQILTIGDGSPCELELVSLSGAGPSSNGTWLVAFRTIRLPDAGLIQKRLCRLSISAREATVIACALRGQRSAEIAQTMGITEYTVKDHLKHIYAKLGVSSRAQLLAALAAEGLALAR